MQGQQLRPAARRVVAVVVGAGANPGWWRMLGGAALTLLAALTVGCAEALTVVSKEPLDAARRTRMSVGVGAATVNPGESPVADTAATLPDLSSAVSFQASVARRLANAGHAMALSAGIASHVVTESQMVGGPTSGCRVQWWSIGPTAIIEAPAASPIWFAGDIGVASVRAARSACAATGYAARGDSAVSVSPSIGFSMNFALGRRFGWSLGGHWVRIPLDDIGLATNTRWGGAGAVSAVIAF